MILRPHSIYAGEPIGFCGSQNKVMLSCDSSQRVAVLGQLVTSENEPDVCQVNRSDQRFVTTAQDANLLRMPFSKGARELHECVWMNSTCGPWNTTAFCLYDCAYVGIPQFWCVEGKIILTLTNIKPA